MSRYNVKKKKWVSSGMSFLKHNWKKGQSDLRIIVAARNDGKGNINYTDKISIDTNGDFTRDADVVFSLSTEMHAFMLFNQNFDRCTALGENASDGGYGTREGRQIYHFNGFSFYLVPEIRE
ncbi:hypothetical protein FKX85_11195 [Echinicola soli]|uniref:Uncharacterized protein n=1 Tax=Echinicola soli TaxID=2591634 RepID=A0A514CIC8_9BACT|nr:hypothetical protein [Echinicola soli]QDH79572.1 hypothetical protein FKX85_11195 [Echinicola soli]